MPMARIGHPPHRHQIAAQRHGQGEGGKGGHPHRPGMSPAGGGHPGRAHPFLAIIARLEIRRVVVEVGTHLDQQGTAQGGQRRHEMERSAFAPGQGATG
jgi:hypothetical protein